MTVIKICNRIIEYSFYFLFFLVPLVIASDTSELFEFNKMWLTFGLSLIIAETWLTKMILQRRIFIQRTPLDIPILLFLLSQFIATIFSWDMHVSFWGYYSRFNGGLLSIITYIFLYYAFLSNFSINAVAIVKRSLFVSLFSGLVVALWGLPSHFGHDPTCFLFRGIFDVSCWTEDFQPRVRIFSTLGQPNWLAAYLAILLPITVALIFIIQKYQTQKPRFPLILLIPFLLLILFYLDLLYTRSRSGILAVWVSLFLFFVIYFLHEKIKYFKLLSFIIFTLFIITFIIGVPFNQLHKLTFEGIKNSFSKPLTYNPSPVTKPEVSPQNEAHAGEIGGTDSGSIRNNVWPGAINIWKQYPIFGTGVETFAYSYYRYKPATQNLTSEWNFLYNKAHNEYLNYLATTGIVGLGTYLLIIGTFIIHFLRYLNHKSQITNHKQIQNTKYSNTKHIGNWNLSGICNFEFRILQLALLASYLSILVTNFFGFSVVITNIYLFMIPAFVFVLNDMIDKEKQNHQSPVTNHNSQISYYQWMFIAILLFAICYLLFALLKFWLADKSYSLGYNLSRAREHLEADRYLHKAVQQREEPVFKDELAVNDAFLAVFYASQKDSTNKDNAARANDLAKEAIDISDQLTTNYENNVVFWKSRTRIFYTLSQVDPRYLPQALQSIEKTAELAPNDASISYNLGVLYGQNNNLKKSIEVLEKTIKLKPNYQDAYYALGLIYHEAAIDKEGKVINSALQKKAIEQMRFILTNLAPNNKSVKEALDSWEKR